MQCLSVIVPCFNEASTIKELLTRVLDSPFTAEVIIVDDGSTDETVSVAESVADRRILLIRQPRNMEGE